MTLEQQESFELKGPQLEVFGKAESKLPVPARRRPFANIVLALAVLVSVFGIGGARLKARQNDVLAQFSATNQYNQGIRNDLAAQADAAASFIRLAETAWGPEAVQEAQDALDAWNAAASDPTSLYEAEHRLYNAIDGLYNAYVREHALSPDAKERLEGLYATFVSTQAVIDRESAAYNEEARAFNRTADAFPANLIGALWGSGEVPLFAASGAQTPAK